MAHALLNRVVSRLVGMSRREAALLFLAALMVLLFGQLTVVILSPLDLAPDEAHYWAWSKRLGLAYYSKGPLIAWVINLFCRLFGDTVLGVRAGALASQLLFSVVLFCFLLTLVRPAIALLTVIGLRLTLLFWEMSIVMTTDPPTALFWLCALVLGAVAVQRDDSRWWFPSCFFIGVAGLTKYTAYLLVPSVLVFLVLSPRYRRHLQSVGLAGGLLLVALSLVPVLLWNAQHGWVNFAHNVGHVAHGSGIEFRPQYVLELLLGQLGLLGPVVFAAVVWAYVQGWRRWRGGDELSGFLVLTALPLIVLCLGVALTKRVYANWPMPVYVTGAVLFALALDRGLLRHLGRWLGAALAFNAVLLVAAHAAAFGFTFGLSPEMLPTKKLVGWRGLGAHVAALTDTPEDLFLIAENYDVASELEFYARRETFVANFGARRMNQYDIWGGWEELRGRDALLVLRDAANARQLEPFFTEIVPLGDGYTVTYGGQLLRGFVFFRAHNYSGALPPVPERY